MIGVMRMCVSMLANAGGKAGFRLLASDPENEDPAHSDFYPALVD